MQAATLLDLSPDQLIRALETNQRFPEFFFKTTLGAECEEYQNRILRAIVEHDRVAISACHDVGKSWTLARVVLWFGSCFPYSKIITTAPTGRQVEKILWSEIKSAYVRAKQPLGGRMLQTEWKLTEQGDWFALGFSPSNEANVGEGQGTQSTFQGFHAPYLLVIFDEATGVKPALWTMAEGLLTSHNVKFVCIGNPTSTQSEFYKCFTNRAWFKIKLSCFDSPNLIANGITNKEELFNEVEYCRALNDEEFMARMKSYKVVKGYLLTLRWVIEKALDWGLDSALFLSKVLGEFPEEGENVAIPLRIVEEAQRREAPEFNAATDRKVIGVDPARFGTDSTVITRMRGVHAYKKRALNKKRGTEVVGEIVNECAEEMPDIIVVDETGMGGPIVDMLIELRDEGLKIAPTVEIRGVQFGAGFDHDTKEWEKYVNHKARMYDLLAEDMRSCIVLLDEEVYQAELPTIQYRFDTKGRKEIESKDKYKKRTGRGSPDHSDSLALANYGRYDELSVGSFTEHFKPKTEGHARPRSFAKKGNRQW